MGDPKFTPGPWLFIAEDDSDPDTTLVTTQNRINNSKVEIATIDTGYVCEIGEEQEANMHLIAAAPDLYHALVAVEGIFRISSCEESADMIDRVLAKARGEL